MAKQPYAPGSYNPTKHALFHALPHVTNCLQVMCAQVCFSKSRMHAQTYKACMQVKPWRSVAGCTACTHITTCVIPQSWAQGYGTPSTAAGQRCKPCQKLAETGQRGRVRGYLEKLCLHRQAAEPFGEYTVLIPCEQTNTSGTLWHVLSMSNGHTDVDISLPLVCGTQ